MERDDEPPRRPSNASNPDIFDDDFGVDVEPDEDDFMPSEDDFRPAHVSEGLRNDRLDHDRSAPLRQITTSEPSENDLRRAATRNSTAKARNSTARDERSADTQTRRPRSPSPLRHRASVSSTASFATMSNSENPFETGPSHPYGMYPQDTMARPSSVATTSTERQPRRSMSLQRPTHPYAMYSQTGLDVDPPEEPTHPVIPPIQTAIPVGFPGLSTGYHRVLGPDGEEQDIIGPDGHTEQLPPYTRYPEEGPTKASMAAEASASRILPAPNPITEAEDPFTTPISPVSSVDTVSFSTPALPAEPLLPTVTPARLPPQRPETQNGSVAFTTSVTPTATQVPAEPSESSSASLLTTERGFSEKDDPAETKVSWRRRKLWGKVPIGVAVVVLILTFVFAIVLGAAIGTLLAKKHQAQMKLDHNRQKEEPMPQVSATRGPLFDATPIPTPPGLGLLPTGAFSLPLGIPQESNPGCLTQASQYSAWSCKLTFAPLIVTINNTFSDDGPHQVASMKSCGSVPDGAILYGLQTPDLALEPLQLVLDLDYRAYGPAYHFATRYDKLVILRSEELDAGPGLRTRQNDKNFLQRFQVRPGDLPWYCYWNQTYIEGYVYVEDNSTAASFASFPTQLPTASTTASFDTSSFLAMYATSTSSTGTGTGTAQTSSAGLGPTPSPVLRRDAQAQNDSQPPPRIPPYPRIFKVEERRLPDSPPPYCQQMVLLDNGKIAVAPNGNDGPKKVELQAVDPTYDEYYAAQATATSNASNSRRGVVSVGRRSDPSDSCHCQWMFK